jgi:hypothetical protein
MLSAIDMAHSVQSCDLDMRVCRPVPFTPIASLSAGKRWAICRSFRQVVEGTMAKRDESKPPRKDKPADPPPSSPGASEQFPFHEHIGRQLKAMFDEVVEQPVPDKFRELLKKLGDKEPKP